MRVSLSVPEPCHEDWSAMSVRDGARFCGSCQHDVADLTRATDGELLRLFGGGDVPKCARFDPRQLDRVLRTADERKVNRLPIAAFTSLLALLSGNEALGQHGVVVGKPIARHAVQPHGTPTAEHPHAPGPRRITISGRLVKDSTDHPLDHGFVQLWSAGQEIRTYSDPTGRFNLVFEATADSIELFFGGADRDPFTQFVSWADTSSSGPLTIDLGEVRMASGERIGYLLGEVAVHRRPTWRFRLNHH